jgi:MFS transporter, FSR family, fosmidomycin resistance protein
VSTLPENAPGIAAPVDESLAAPAAKREQRRALIVACGAHALHDGYTDLTWLALPIWQGEFGLSYAAVGFLRTMFSGTMAALQIPSAALAERIGVRAVLALGTAMAGVCYVIAGVSAGFAVLIAALLLGGLGAATQHPLASALVARAFAGPRAITAFGTYNFAGDIGKVAVPAAATALLLVMPWRPAYGLLGLVGIAAGIAIFMLTPGVAPEPSPENRDSHAGAAAAARPAGVARAAGAKGRAGFEPGYFLLLSLAAIDSVTRSGFLVFLPFLLIAKGASVTTAGFALTLTFLGGAAGKLACAWISARFGVIGTICTTEGLTAAGIVAMVFLPLEAAVTLLPALGVVLNGTSSATYGSVPHFASAAERNRAFSWFYTGTLGAGALAPTVAGLIGDIVGIPTAVTILAALVLTTLPLAWALRGPFAAARAS